MADGQSNDDPMTETRQLMEQLGLGVVTMLRASRHRHLGFSLVVFPLNNPTFGNHVSTLDTQEAVRLLRNTADHIELAEAKPQGRA